MTKLEKYFKEDILPNDAYKLLADFLEYYKDYWNAEKIKKSDEELAWDFLTQQVKPTLTEDEKVILRNFDKKWEYICRLKKYDGEYVLTLANYWEYNCRDINQLECYNHLFQFIKPEEEYEISDLLEE